MKAHRWKPGTRLALVMVGLALIALPLTASAQEPTQATPAGDLDARLRKLEELNAKLEKQNEKLAEQNDKLEKQNQVIQAASPAIAPNGAKSSETKAVGEAAPKEAADAAGYVIGSDPVFKVQWQDGFIAETANKDFRIHIGGRFQEDLTPTFCS